MKVPLERSRRSLSLRFGLGGLGIEAGKLSFSAQSSWFGPECKGGKGTRGRPAVCADRSAECFALRITRAIAP